MINDSLTKNWILRPLRLLTGVATCVCLASHSQAATLEKGFKNLPFDSYISLAAGHIIPDDSTVRIDETCFLCNPASLTLRDIEFDPATSLFIRGGMWGKERLDYLGMGIEIGYQRLKADEVDMQHIEINLLPLLRWFVIGNARNCCFAASLYGGPYLTTIIGNADVEATVLNRDFNLDTLGLGLGLVGGLEIRVDNFSFYAEYREQPDITLKEFEALSEISLAYSEYMLGVSYHFQ